MRGGWWSRSGWPWLLPPIQNREHVARRKEPDRLTVLIDHRQVPNAKPGHLDRDYADILVSVNRRGVGRHDHLGFGLLRVEAVCDGLHQVLLRDDPQETVL